MLTAGDKIGNYEILAPLKSGGMGALFLGRRLGASGFAKAVAIKVIHHHLVEDESFVRSFINEALLASRIAHPNVVQVEELAEQDGMHYLVMEYIRGVTLSRFLGKLRSEGRALAPDGAVAIAAQAAEGLHAAHETLGDDGQPIGVVHRDVTPHNILLTKSGHIKLIDFGIAKAAGFGGQTAPTFLKGKLSYMSPEQAYGKPVDRRTDVYSLSILLWEMLTFRRLFKKDDQMATLELVRNPSAPKPSDFMRDVPASLDDVVMRALSVERDERPATAQEFRSALLDALPSAKTIDARHLAELFLGAAGDEFDRLPRLESEPSLSSGNRPSPAVAMATLTVSAEDLGRDQGEHPVFEESRHGNRPEEIAQSKTKRRRLRFAIAVVVAGLICGIMVTGIWMRSVETVTPPTPESTASPSDVTTEAPALDLPKPTESRKQPAIEERTPLVNEKARVERKSRRRRPKQKKQDLVDGVPIEEQPDF